jgi:hypothetical protein
MLTWSAHTGIALRLLQHLALTQASKVWSGSHGSLRTCSSAVLPETVVQHVNRAELFTSMRRKARVFQTLQIIPEKAQEAVLDKENTRLSSSSTRPRRSMAEHVRVLRDLFLNASIVADGEHAKSLAAQF